MIQPIGETEELRITLDRLSTLLETLVVRGVRACGPDELAQLRSFAEHLDHAGAGHVAMALNQLHNEIEHGNRAAATSLLMAQTSVRLLGRLLTIRVVDALYAAAIANSADRPADADALEDDEP